MHAGIRKWLAAQVSDKVAQETRIIYGGSVSGKNCRELGTLLIKSQCMDVAGGVRYLILVGGFEVCF